MKSEKSPIPNNPMDEAEPKRNKPGKALPVVWCNTSGILSAAVAAIRLVNGTRDCAEFSASNKNGAAPHWRKKVVCLIRRRLEEASNQNGSRCPFRFAGGERNAGEKKKNKSQNDRFQAPFPPL